MEEFDEAAHDAKVNRHYSRLAMFDAFDRFVDLALDSVISMPEALQAFKEEYGEQIN